MWHLDRESYAPNLPVAFQDMTSLRNQDRHALAAVTLKYQDKTYAQAMVTNKQVMVSRSTTAGNGSAGGDRAGTVHTVSTKPYEEGEHTNENQKTRL